MTSLANPLQFALDLETFGFAGEAQIKGLTTHGPGKIRPNIFSISMMQVGLEGDPQGAFVGHTRTGLNHGRVRFDKAEFMKLGESAVGVDESKLTGRHRTTEFTIKKGSPFDDFAELLESKGYMSKTNLPARGAPGQPRVYLSADQIKYLETHAPSSDFIKKFIDPSVTEAAGKYGTHNPFATEKEMMQAFYEKVKGIEKQAVTNAKGGVYSAPELIGHNIGDASGKKGFDIKTLLKGAEETIGQPKADELKGILKRWKIRDTQQELSTALRKMYLEAPKAVRETKLGQAWTAEIASEEFRFARGKTLDIGADLLEIEGRSSTSAHGGVEDSLLSHRVADELDSLKPGQLTPQKHAETIIKHAELGTTARDARAIDQANELLETIRGGQAVVKPTKEPVVKVTEPKPSTDPVEWKKVQDRTSKFVHEKLKIPRSVTGIFSKITHKKLAVAAGVGAAAWLALSRGDEAKDIRRSTQTLFDSITQPMARRSEYITSSVLGKTQEADIIGRVYQPGYSDRNKTQEELRRGQAIMDAGTALHEQIQSEMMSMGTATATEVYVEDPTNKVFGTIDAMLSTGTPLEIKTISGKGFRNLRGPRPEHISQANFYALAKGTSTAAIMYVSRENPAERRVFSINADHGRYLKDIETIQHVQERTAKLAPKSPYLHGFRPLNSWFGGGINYNISSRNKSKRSNQRARLSGLPVSQLMPQQPHYRHPNASRAGQ